MAEMAAGTSGARCAIHAAAPADRICERCGNFMCTECSQGGTKTLCPNCTALVGSGEFPLRRDSWDFGRLWDYCWNAFKREWLLLSVSVLVFIMIAGVVGAITGGINTAVTSAAKGAPVVTVLSAVMAQVIAQLAQGAFEMGLYRIYMDVLNGQKADVGRMFSQFSKLGTYFVQRILLLLFFVVPLAVYFGILVVVAALVAGGGHIGDPSELADKFGENPAAVGVIALGFLIVVVPLVYFALPLYFASMEIVLNDGVSPMDSLRNCYAIAKDQRMSIFGIGLLSGLIGGAGILACCIGIFPGIALGQSLLTGLFLALRAGTGLPEPGRPAAQQT